MFEQLKMSNKLKRQLGSAVSMLLTVALLVTGLPADLLGGVASVKAAEKTSAGAPTDVTGSAQVDYYQSDWGKSSKSDVVLGENERLTTWDFLSKASALSSNETVNVNASLAGIMVVAQGYKGDGTATNASLKKNGTEGLSVYGKGAIELPLSEATSETDGTPGSRITSVKVKVKLTSNQSKRNITFGNETTKETVTQAATIEKTYDSSYMTIDEQGKAWLRLTMGGTDESDNQESKIGSIEITVTRSADDDDDGDDDGSKGTHGDGDVTGGDVTGGDVTGGDTDEFITRTTTYDFRDGSIIPMDTGYNGNTEVKSADGLLTITPGASNGFGWNGNQHGAIFKTGNIITIHVLGKAKVDVAGCSYSNGSMTATVNGSQIKDFTKTQTEKCYHQDSSAVLSFDYDGEEADLVLTFNSGSNYVPFISVERTEPKPDKTEVKATVTVNDENNLLQPGDTIKLKDQAGTGDGIDITDANKTEYTLNVNSTYDIVSSNEDIKATANGVGTVTTTTEDLIVTVDLAATVVNPTVKFNVADDVPADAEYTISLVNGEDTIELKDGETVKLKIGETYTLQCSNAELEARISGGILLTVTADLSELIVNIAGQDKTHHTYDVWDFGGELLQDTDLIKYNNKLTKDIMNAWFDLEPGSIAGQSDLAKEGEDLQAGDDLVLKSAGNKGKWRLRGLKTNTDLTSEQNEDSLTDEYGNAYQGIMYSNATSSADKEPMHMLLTVKAGDMVYAIVSSNGTNSTITWESPSGVKQTFVFTRASRTKLQHTTIFTAAEDGDYKLYSADEKLVVARIYRERPTEVTVSGTVTLPAGDFAWTEDAQLLFTNQTTGQVCEAEVTNAGGALTYSVKLPEQYTYDVSVENIDGCVVGANNTLTLKNEAGDTTFDVDCIAVELVTVTGSLADLTPEAAANLTLSFKNAEQIYVPKVTIDAENVTFSGKFEKGITYNVVVSGVNDYTLETTTFKADEDGTQDIKFNKKPVYPINVTLEGPTAEEAANVALTFSNINEEGYVYSFTGTTGIELRDGQYSVKAELAGYTQKVTSDVKVNGEAVNKTIVMIPNTAATPVEYKEAITVGPQGDYKSINDALDAVRLMNRTSSQRVTISIAPGDYEEMLVIDVPNVTLKNASATPSIELKNKGVDIDENAVRITSYYGHGYAYYSMGSDCKWDGDLLEANKENGYYSFENPGSGTTSGSYWNATVVVGADGFQAEGIIFENSFNQYVSKKAAEDVIVPLSSAKEGSTPRAEMKAGDTTVQDKKYVERAAALAIKNDVSQSSFDNCKFVGRQDTLYGGRNSTVAFYGCSIYGGTDYIFGPMIAVFAKCDLVLNTMEDNNDVAYITAAQQTSGRGYLMYNCEVKSTTPGVDTASEKVSKPGYFGRPWEAKTSEVVFYYTVIGTASDGTSLIAPDGWNNSLSGESEKVYEFNTYERTEGVDNSSKRVSWAKVLTEPKLSDNKAITVATFLGKWNPFEGKDMTIVLPDGTTVEEPTGGSSTPTGDNWSVELEETSYVYTGTAIKPVVYVFGSDGEALVENTDYTVKYSNNVKTSVGATKLPTVTITGKGNLTGKTTVNFEIKQANLGDATHGDIIIETGKKASTPVLSYNGIKLTAKDYEYVTDKNTTYTEDGTLELKGKGNFTGSLLIDVRVMSKAELKATVKKFKVTVDSKKAKTDLIFTGDDLTQAIKDCITVEPSKKDDTTEMAENEHYAIVLPSEVTEAGTVKVMVVGLGDYSGCSVSKSVKILPRTITGSADEVALDKVVVNYKSDQLDYTSLGATLEDLEVEWQNGYLVNGKDFKLTYSGNKKVGTAKYTIAFKGNYKGKVTGTFTINKAVLDDSTAKVVLIDKVVKDGAACKSTAYVTMGEDKVLIKASEYEITYIVDGQETASPKVSFGDEASKTIDVKIKAKAKSKNFTTDGNELTGSYTVWKKDSGTDLSKAKVTFYEDEACTKKATKLQYTGGEVVPAGVTVTIGNDTTNLKDKCEIIYVNNVNKGKVTVIVKSDDSSLIGSKVASFNIVAKSAANGGLQLPDMPNFASLLESIVK